MFNAVILGNTGALTEMNAGCAATFSAWVGGSGTGTQDLTTCGATAAQRAAAIFDNPTTGDYHPKKGGSAPCTLVGLGTATGAPMRDLEGTTRPSPPSIGALEAK